MIIVSKQKDVLLLLDHRLVVVNPCGKSTGTQKTRLRDENNLRSCGEGDGEKVVGRRV